MRYFYFLVAFFLAFPVYSQIVSEDVSFNHGGCSFQATLTKPSGSGPFTTLVLVPGSGQNDRNGTIVMSGGNINCLYPNLAGDTLEIYKQLAEDLSDSGYAVLRYDELTISCPAYSGPLNYGNVFLPATSAIDYLKTRTDVDTNNIILMGHSEGAALIPYMASKRNDIKAMISLAGARTPFDSLLAYQIVNIAKTCGQDTNQAKTQAQQILSYFTTIRNGTYNSSTPPFGGLAAAQWEKYIHVNDSVAILYQQGNVPSLFIGFGNDINVPPSELVRFQNELNGDFTFYGIPNLIHYMTTNNNPDVPRTVADTIVYWLRNKFVGLNEFYTGHAGPIQCYPNPFRDEITIFVPGKKSQLISVKIYDPEGKIVWREDYLKSSREGCLKLELKDLNQGFYNAEIKLSNRSYFVKILKG